MSDEHIPNEIEPELIGLHSLNFATGNNSSPRSVMFSSHFSQRLVIDGSTEKIIQTGLEKEFGKYTLSIKMPANGTVLKVIDRYPKGIDIDSINFNPETLVIYENAETREIDCFSIPYYQSYHQYFGFKNKETQEMSRLVPGNFIEKDTIFSNSPAISDNGGFKYGVSLNTAFMSHPAVSEDGVLVSRSALDKLTFSVFETRVVEFSIKNFPLNLYGNVSNYKAFPDIGEEIRSDGILMMLRKSDPDNAPVEMSVYDTMDPQFIFDTAYYVRGEKGIVVDIKIYKDDNSNNMLPENMVKNMQKYVKGLRNYHSQIVGFETDIRNNKLKKTGSDAVNLSPALHRLIVESYAVLNKPSKKHNHKLNILYRKSPLSEYKAVFTIEYKIRPSIGFKITDTNGGKGVICKIEEDENMPVDIDGNRAEIIMDSGSTIARMNLGRLYEQYIGAVARDVRKLIKSNFNVSMESRGKVNKIVRDLYTTKPEVFNSNYSYLLEFYKAINVKQYEYFLSLSEEDRLHHMADIIYDDLYVFYPINNDKEIVDVVKDLNNGPFKTTYGPVSYVGGSGNRVTTFENIRIGPVYFMLLEKIADDWSSVSYGKLQHFGVLSLMTKSEKYTYPYRNNPVRTIGESEARVYLGYLGRKAIAEMMDRANNPLAQKQMVWKILDADRPGSIDKLVDRDLVPFGTSKPLQLFKHICSVSGWRSVWKPEK